MDWDELQSIAFSCLGLKPKELMELTPREFNNLMDGYKIKEENEWEKISFLAAWVMQSNGAKVSPEKLFKKTKVKNNNKVDIDEKKNTLNELSKRLGV